MYTLSVHVRKGGHRGLTTRYARAKLKLLIALS